MLAPEDSSSRHLEVPLRSAFLHQCCLKWPKDSSAFIHSLLIKARRRRFKKEPSLVEEMKIKVQKGTTHGLRNEYKGSRKNHPWLKGWSYRFKKGPSLKRWNRFISSSVPKAVSIVGKWTVDWTQAAELWVLPGTHLTFSQPCMIHTWVSHSHGPRTGWLWALCSADRTV